MDIISELYSKIFYTALYTLTVLSDNDIVSTLVPLSLIENWQYPEHNFYQSY